MISKSILKNQLLLANAAATFRSIGVISHNSKMVDELRPWQIEAMSKIYSVPPNTASVKVENRKNFQKVLREDLNNERKR